MGKIICEVCGTVYPDSADCCPICGYSRDHGGFSHGAGIPDFDNVPQYTSAPQESLEDFDLSEYADLAGMEYENHNHNRPSQQPNYQAPQQPPRQADFQPTREPPRQAPRQPQRQIFDYDAVNPQERRRFDTYEDVGNEVTLNDYPQDSYDNYDRYHEGRHKSHTGLIIFLVLLIVALIAASAFLVFKFILPNLLEPQQTLPPETMVIMTEAPTTEPTTQPTIPCESLTLVEGGEVDLSREGQFYLIHATVSPENTTDQLTYQSEDENIILVDAGGKITAVGEGQTNVVLTCGSQIIRLPVSVIYRDETEGTEDAENPTAPAPAETTAEGETAADEETASEGETTANEETAPEKETKAPAGGTAEESADATEETTEATEPEIELKLKKSDLQSGVMGVSFRLELDCPLKPEDIEWSTTDMRVATVKNGVVTTVGSGICKIVAKYGSQEVSCIIRCAF